MGYRSSQTMRFLGLMCVVVFMAAACTGADDANVASSDSDAEPADSSVSGDEEAPEPVDGDGGDVTVRMIGDWDTLDPHKINNPAQYVMFFTYSQLTAVDDNGMVIPYVADSWEATPSSATFHIRDDVVCADGTLLTPEAVYNSFVRYTDPDTGGRNIASVLGPGPHEFSFDNDAGTFTIDLGTPFNDLATGLARYNASIICPAGLEADADFDANSYGAGPFTLAENRPGDVIEVVSNPAFAWGPNGESSQDAGAPNAVRFRLVLDESTAVNLLLTGEIDSTLVDTPQNIQRLQNEDGLLRQQAWPMANHQLLLNHSEGLPGADQTIRRALFGVVDAEGYNQALFLGLGQTATSIISEFTPCYDPSTADLIPRFSVEEAQALLAEDGWELVDGLLTRDGETIDLTLDVQASSAPGGEYIAQQWTALGVDLTLNVLEDAAWLGATYGTQESEAAPLILRSPGNTPTPIIGFYSAGLNIPHIEDEVLEDLKNDAWSADTEEARCEAWGAVQRRFLEEDHLLPLVTAPIVWFSNGVDVQADGQTITGWGIRRVQ